MSYFLTTASYGSTGVKTIACGFQPNRLKITVSSSGASQAVNHTSEGVTDGTNAVCVSTFTDGTGSSSWFTTGKMVSHFTRVSGTLTEHVAATFDSFTATQAKFNVTAFDANYTFRIEIWG